MPQISTISSANDQDLWIGKTSPFPFTFPENDAEFEFVQPRNIEVWSRELSSFYIANVQRLRITSTGIVVSGSASISGSLSVGGSATVSQTVSASDVTAQTYGNGTLSLTFEQIYNAVMSIENILLRLQALESQSPPA